VLPFSLLADHVPRGLLPAGPSKRKPEQGALF